MRDWKLIDKGVKGVRYVANRNAIGAKKASAIENSPNSHGPPVRLRHPSHICWIRVMSRSAVSLVAVSEGVRRMFMGKLSAKHAKPGVHLRINRSRPGAFR